MEVLITVISILIGLILIILEVLFLPGLITGIIGGLFIIFGIVYATLNFGFSAGAVSLAFSLLSMILLFILFKKLKVWNRFVLNYAQTSSILKDKKLNGSDLLGKTGITLTDLRPAGFILVENRKFDAQTNGEFIPKNSQVEIISVNGIKITVKKIEDKL